jgi:hypothetical protein
MAVRMTMLVNDRVLDGGAVRVPTVLRRMYVESSVHCTDVSTPTYCYVEADDELVVHAFTGKGTYT